jgi:hypothetical protein
MSQIQNFKQNRFGYLVIENWNLFGIWDLEFVIWDFKRYGLCV